MTNNVLYRTLKVGQNIHIGDTVIHLESKTGQQARLRIESPSNIVIKQAQECHQPSNGDDYGANKHPCR